MLRQQLRQQFEGALSPAERAGLEALRQAGTWGQALVRAYGLERAVAIVLRYQRCDVCDGRLRQVRTPTGEVLRCAGARGCGREYPLEAVALDEVGPLPPPPAGRLTRVLAELREGA